MNNNQLQNHDPDDNFDILNDNQDVYACDYYSIDSFNTHKTYFSEMGLSVVCFNIRSFTKHSDEFLAYLSSCNHTFDIIVLTETWAKEETHTLCEIPGYDSSHNFRPNRKGGGVSIFVNQKHKFETIDELNISNISIESAAISLIYPNNKKINILGIYRPPKGDANSFTDTVRDIINNNNSFHTEDTIITGDMNICLLNENHSNITDNFMNMMRAAFFRPIITRPTRFTEDTSTIIDHIWINTTFDVTSMVFYSKITDHCPIFCRLAIPMESNGELVKVKFRDMKRSNKVRFQDMLNNVSNNWGEIIPNTANTNDQTSKLIDTLTNYYNTCFPIMTKYVSAKRLTKPWITNAILKSINTKHKLFKRVMRNGYDRNAFNRYCNTLNCVLKTSKSSYYREQFNKYKNDIKRTWSVINSTIKPGKRYKSIVKLYHDNVEITDPQKIADTLNNHFAGIGRTLLNALPPRSSTAYQKHLA